MYIVRGRKVASRRRNGRAYEDELGEVERKRREDDVYDFERSYRNASDLLNKTGKITEHDKELIWKFIDVLKALRVSKGRLAKYLYHLKTICENLGMKVESANRQDVEHFVAQWLYEQDYSAETNADYIMILKRFYKFVRSGNVDKETPFPPEVRWLKKTIKANEQREPDFLTPDEVEKLILAAETSRDKAMIAVQFDAGFRPGELLLANVGDTKFDDKGARLTVRGKTGERPVRLIPSVALLARYLETHPLKNDPKAPLWITDSTNYKNQRLGWKTWDRILKRAAEKAGLQKVSMQSKMLRHGSVTESSNFLSDQQLKIKHGWTKDSRMLNRYGHLKAKDLDDKLVSIHTGKEIKREIPEFTFVICPRCHERGSPGQSYCSRCGMSLSKAEVAKNSSELQEMWNELQNVKEFLRKSLEASQGQPRR